MIDMDSVIRRLEADAQAIRALVGSISEEQAQWKPAAEVWSMKEVMTHVYNEERIDFRMHLQEILSHPQQPWGALDTEGFKKVGSCHEALEKFLAEREDSIAWLKSLPAQDWDLSIHAVFDATHESTLKAGNVLLSWVEHDYLHLRQMIEVLHALNEKSSKPYSLRYAGGW